MIKDIYQHEGITYRRTNKVSALKLIQDGKYFFIVGSNVNQAHFHAGHWCALHPHKIGLDNIQSINDVISLKNSFEFYLESELGRYSVFYVEI